METKTKEDKYFSQLGTWPQLLGWIIKIAFFTAVLKLFGVWVGSIIVAIVMGLFYFVTIKKQLLKPIIQKIKNISLKNWFLILSIIFIVFGIYWFGIRPGEIRKSCAIIKWTESGRAAVPASPNWPECQKEKPFDNVFKYIGEPNFEEKKEEYAKWESNCYPAKEMIPESSGKRKARDSEYQQCLRENGL